MSGDQLRVQVSIENVKTGTWTEYDFPCVTEMQVTEDPNHTDPIDGDGFRGAYLMGIRSHFNLYAVLDEEETLCYVRSGRA